MNTRDLRQHLASGRRAVFDLSRRAKFLLTGADCIRYLNGQVSNDVRPLISKPGEAIPACVMTAKGKINAFAWISGTADAIRLDADPELREPLAARLERYVISDDVTISDVTDNFSLFHVMGIGEPQSDPDKTIHSRRFGLDGVDFFPPIEVRFAIPDSLEVDLETAETFRIEQGIPRWGAELDENTIPPEAGLDAAAIDYHKGCYIGQEVISRLKSIGHVNRHLRGFVADTPLASGMVLFHGGNQAGVLTSAAWSFALDKAVALGYLKRSIEAAALTAEPAATVGSPDAARIPVALHPLPFIA